MANSRWGIQTPPESSFKNIKQDKKNGWSTIIDKWMGKDNQTLTTKERMAGARQLASLLLFIISSLFNVDVS